MRRCARVCKWVNPIFRVQGSWLMLECWFLRLLLRSISFLFLSSELTGPPF